MAKKKYSVARFTFKNGETLTLPAGQSIVQVIDKLYDTFSVTLVLLIEHNMEAS